MGSKVGNGSEERQRRQSPRGAGGQEQRRRRQQQGRASSCSSALWMTHSTHLNHVKACAEFKAGWSRSGLTWLSPRRSGRRGPRPSHTLQEAMPSSVQAFDELFAAQGAPGLGTGPHSRERCARPPASLCLRGQLNRQLNMAGQGREPPAEQPAAACCWVCMTAAATINLHGEK